MRAAMRQGVKHASGWLLPGVMGVSVACANPVGPGLADQVEKANHPGSGEVSCDRSSSGGRFRELSDLIRFACEEGPVLTAPEFKEQLKSRGGDALLKRLKSDSFTPEELYQDLVFFKNSQDQYVKDYAEMKSSDWKPLTEKSPCRYRVKSKAPVQEMDFGAKDSRVRFLGVRHFGSLSPGELPKAKTDLQRRLVDPVARPGVVLLEGYGNKIGRPADCQYVLQSAFTPDEQVRDEGQLSEKIAFRNRIAIYPADNQYPDESDRRLFLKKSKEFTEMEQYCFHVDFLHNYMTELSGQNGSAPEHALENAIRETYRRHPVTGGEKELGPADFRKWYKKVNGLDLPTTPEELFKDFTPSEFSPEPRATQKMADHQDLLRNESLLLAIQLAAKRYTGVGVVYGSGHLAKIGPTLEKHLQPVTNVDLTDACQ
ncbi:MAG: hypothetical protein EBX52_08675 [Proteobacteria bacterium]|nr:hypothetical protein [Pseudomonadota bacterium]